MAEVLANVITGWQAAQAAGDDLTTRKAIAFADRVADLLISGRENW